MQNLQKIVKSLDFNARPRKTRTDNEIIELHDRKDPDERVRTLIVLMYKEVIFRRDNLSQLQRMNVLDNCAKIIMYDFGYKEAKNYKGSFRWMPKLKEYF